MTKMSWRREKDSAND